MAVKLLDLTQQYNQLKSEIMPVIEKVCDSQMFINGPYVQAFEENFARFCDTPFAIGCSSGTDALLLSLTALDIGPGDEVITTPFTFFATIEVIIRRGATPVLVDIDETTFNLDAKLVEAAITENTKAIIPVHIFGQCADMSAITSIAEYHNLHVIEDAAQAHGAEWDGQRAGSIGTFGCFSFFPSKNLGGFGDGGAITMHSEDHYRKLLSLRQHGINLNKRYAYRYVGGNFRLDAMQAAVLDVKLKHLDEWIQLRQRNAAFYDENLRGCVKPVALPNCTHVYNQYTIRVNNRDEVTAHLAENEVGYGIYYPYPLHLQPNISWIGAKEGDFPVCEAVCEEVLSLPIYPELTMKELETVATVVNEVCEHS